MDDNAESLSAQLQELRRENDLLRNLARRVPGMLYQYRRYPDGRSSLPFASEGIREVFGVEPGQVKEDSLIARQFLHPEDAAAYAESIERSYRTLEPWYAEFRVVLPRLGLRWMEGNGTPERLSDGSVLWHGHIQDVTARKAGESHTRQLAYYDGLTGLPNRELLRHRISNTVFDAARTGRIGALLFLDLDNFKRINDARGHSVGDAVLAQVAQRISALAGPDDLVARIGGDEFVMLVPNLAARTQEAAAAATRIAERLRAALEEVYEVEGSAYTVTGSIGVTLFPRGDAPVSDLLREADTAMYRAKAAGRNRVTSFEADMLAQVRERLELEQELKTALAAGQMRLMVQPQVGMAGRDVGGELLLRWDHPRRGAVPPAKFIPIAEESGLICELGGWVILQACRLLTRLETAGSPLSLSVNISARQFHDPAFVDSVRGTLQLTGARPEQLVFEVTESLFISQGEGEAVAERMQALHQLGIRFSIDDFGTGYSNLGYLRRLPLHELKIDQSFVRDIPQNLSDTAIVRAIISVAKNLKLQVVAEGVESDDQARFLAGIGCDSCQGNFFSKPLTIEQWLEPRILAAQACPRLIPQPAYG